MHSYGIFSIFLGICAGILQVAGYISYSKKINLGKVKPNTASWSIWTFGAILESSTYITLTQDWVKNILPLSCTVSAIILFFVCFKRGHFTKTTNFENFIILADCTALLIWYVYNSALYANIFLVITAIISFIPIIIESFNDPTIENAAPWYLWSSAYLFLVIVVFIRWNKWEDLIYPVTFFALHLIVAFLAMDSRKESLVKLR